MEILCTIHRLVKEFLKEVKVELPCGPAIPLLGISEKLKNRVLRTYLPTPCRSDITCDSQDVETTQMFTDI
jgi:hypothetical protein